MPLARLARTGDLTLGSGPTVAEEAIRDFLRAQEDIIRDLQDATYRRKVFVLRQAIRYVGWAPMGLAHLL